MKVIDILELLSKGTSYELIGAKTGKVFYKSWVNKNLEKFIDLEVPNAPINVSFRIVSDAFIKRVEYTCPIIQIWVSGK